MVSTHAIFLDILISANAKVIIRFSLEKAKNAKLKIVLKKKNFQRKCRQAFLKFQKFLFIAMNN